MLSVRNYKEDDKSLINNDSILELLSEFNYFKNNRIIDNIISNSYPLDTIPSQDMCFYKIKQLSYDEESPKREAFENVLLNMSNSAFNFVYILTGDEKGVELYIGVVKNGSCKNRDNNISASNYGKSIADAFSANFSGSVLEKISEPLLSDMASYSVGVYKNAGVIMGGRIIKPRDLDLRWISALLYRNGVIEESGVAAAVLNHPANGVAWLANKLAPYDVGLEAGQIILGGSFTRPVPARLGDTFHVDYGTMGSISCRFV